MVATPEMRIARIHLESGEPLLPMAISRALTPEQIEHGGTRYKKAREGLPSPNSLDVMDLAAYWSEFAKGF